MKKKNYIKHLMVVLPLIFGTLFAPLLGLTALAESYDCSVNIDTKVYSCNGSSETSIPSYRYDSDYSSFTTAMQNNTLPKIYFTDFLFDGNAPIQNSDVAIPLMLYTDVININTTGNLYFTGTPENGMTLGFNTNGLAADTNLYFGNIIIDSRAVGAPAIYIYNKDPNYKDHKVTLTFVDGTSNQIEGGFIKKTEITDLSKNLFGAVQDSDGKYYYSAGGAISSDIDLTIKGTGYHSGFSLLSKKKTLAVESKGNLTFSGAGVFNLYAKNDCLRAYGDINIDESSIYAVVDSSAANGDAIKAGKAINISNGSTVYALGRPKASSAGLNSTEGLNVSDGLVMSIGMAEEKVSANTTQGVVSMDFTEIQEAGTLIALTSTSGIPLIASEFQRPYKHLTYSAEFISKNGTYNVWSDGTLTATVKKSISFEDRDGTGHPDTALTEYVNGLSWSLNKMMKHSAVGDSEPTKFDLSKTMNFAEVAPSGNTNSNTNSQPYPSPDDPEDPEDPDIPDDPDDPEDPDDPDNPDTPGGQTPGGNSGGGSSGNSSSSNGGSSSNSGSSSNGGSSSNDTSTGDDDYYYYDYDYGYDDDDVAVPYTSAYTTTSTPDSTTVVSPDTGRVTREEGFSEPKSVSPFAWAVSIASASTLVLYVLANRKRHAVRFRN